MVNEVNKNETFYKYIPKSMPISINNSLKENQCNLSIKQGCFDPTKNSPPNFFIQNLEGRYHEYYQNDFSIKDY